MAAKDAAILVADREGIEAFSDDQRGLLGLPRRTD
jgi:hypothetical protein